jgi:hypothetical protein
MKKAEKTRIPSSLQDVWDWKEAVFRETETLSTADALDRIHTGASALRERFGLSVAEPLPAVGLVCEVPGDGYKTKSACDEHSRTEDRGQNSDG